MIVLLCYFFKSDTFVDFGHKRIYNKKTVLSNSLGTCVLYRSWGIKPHMLKANYS